MYRTPYSPSVEHAYGLQQPIATPMEGEINKPANGIYPSTQKFNVFQNGLHLDIQTNLEDRYLEERPRLSPNLMEM